MATVYHRSRVQLASDIRLGPRIAGVSYYEAQAILSRHQATLRQPGVVSYGLSETGVQVTIADPQTTIPSSLETLPVSVDLCEGCIYMALECGDRVPTPYVPMGCLVP